MNYVKHPRYGNKPIPSGESYSEEDVLSAHWSYSSLKIFKETAIKADISKQNYGLYPRKIYVDIEETCNICKRAFIFFAKEQMFWFEQLGFYVDAHCNQCPDCRRHSRNTKSLQKRYQLLVETENRTTKQNKLLKQIAMELFQLGYIKDEKLLRIDTGSKQDA